MSGETTQIEKERLLTWTQRLRREYEAICFSHRIGLNCPVIRIQELESRWGSWDPETRTITLSRKLIDKYSWSVVVEILKHEMAHQWVSDEFGGDDGHGPLFHRICWQLGVADWAKRAETDPLDLSIEATPEEERLLNRAEKLLALAGSNNEHEAMLAMNKVRELYAKYNLERLRERKKSRHVQATIQLRRKRLERYQLAIASLLNDFYFVEIVHANLFDPEACEEFKTIEILGTVQNVQIAEYVFHFLSNQLPIIWKNHGKDGSRGGLKAKYSFYLGVVRGLRDRLQHESANSSESTGGNELSLIKDPQLEDFVHYRYPRLVKIRGGRRYHDSRSFDAGIAAGSRLVIHRGIKENQGYRGKLLR
jgi:predicted SprT family Zn-dependent metalloprotease